MPHFKAVQAGYGFVRTGWGWFGMAVKVWREEIWCGEEGSGGSGVVSCVTDGLGAAVKVGHGQAG